MYLVVVVLTPMVGKRAPLTLRLMASRRITALNSPFIDFAVMRHSSRGLGWNPSLNRHKFENIQRLKNGEA